MSRPTFLQAVTVIGPRAPVDNAVFSVDARVRGLRVTLDTLL